MSDPKAKFNNFKNAISRLNEGINLFDGDELARDGIIQRFEFTFELAWKTLKAVFEDEGLIGLNSPKTVLREALTAGLISDEELWLDMLNDRNSTTHIYSESLSLDIYNRIHDRYGIALEELAKNIESRIKK